MSILAEYNAIAQELGQNEWAALDEYCTLTGMLLSDIIYNQNEYREFKVWYDNKNKSMKRLFHVPE